MFQICSILYQTRILYQYLPTVAEGEDSKVCFIKGNINHHLGSTIQSATIEQLLLNIFEKLRNLKVIMVMEEMIWGKLVNVLRKSFQFNDLWKLCQFSGLVTVCCSVGAQNEDPNNSTIFNCGCLLFLFDGNLAHYS